jgi:hypothetical protein
VAPASNKAAFASFHSHRHDACCGQRDKRHASRPVTPAGKLDGSSHDQGGGKRRGITTNQKNPSVIGTELNGGMVPLDPEQPV